MRLTVSSIFSIFILINLFSLPALAIEKSANKLLTIGLISTKPKKRIKATTPLVDYIVAQLPEYDRGKVIVTDSIDEMASMLESGEVTMLSSTPYGALLIEARSNAHIAGLRWKQGVESYHSVIFSRNDNKINDITDLLGHTISFEKDSSTSGFFVPALYLLNNGFKLQKMRSVKDQPDADKIGYLFINEHLRQSNEINMSIWVFHKRLAAAAFSNLDWDDPDTTPIKAKEKLHVIAETAPFPRGIVLTSPTLSEQSKQTLLQTLFNAENNEQGLSVMQAFQKTSRFGPIPEHLLLQLDKAREQIIAHPSLFK